MLARSERPRGLPCYTREKSPGRIPSIVLQNYVRGGIRYSEKRRQELSMRLIHKNPCPMRLKIIRAANRFIDRIGIFSE